MNQKEQKKLNGRQEIPRIEGATQKQCYDDTIWATENPKFQRWSAIYLGTAMVALVLVGLLVLTVSFSSETIGGSFWDRSLQALGGLFIQQDFMDLSGEQNEPSSSLGSGGFSDVLGGLLIPERGEEQTTMSDTADTGAVTDTQKVPQETEKNDPLTRENLYLFDYSLVPSGETAIVPMDLSLSSYGTQYIHNSTGYKPNTAALLAGKLKQTVDFEYLSASGSPMVLIVHTHATESYSANGAISCDDSGDYARSMDCSKNMVAVGQTLANELEKQGIATLQCTVLHDELQYKDSYRRSEESIKQYLEKYPTIRLVIDLHRDAVIKSSGDIVRPVTLYDGEAAAQLMCVVGSDFGGEACPNWEQNLSLALKLRESLNAACPDLCRPTYLKSSTYNQEFAPYSLLIEVGASGNSLEEAKRSMVLLAASLRELLPQM